jgi:hypothetical protein
MDINLEEKRKMFEQVIKEFLDRNHPLLNNIPMPKLNIVSTSPSSNKITSPCPIPKSLIIEVEFPTGFREVRELGLIITPAPPSMDCEWLAFYSYPAKGEYEAVNIPFPQATGNNVNEALINLAEMLIKQGIL